MVSHLSIDNLTLCTADWTQKGHHDTELFLDKHFVDAEQHGGQGSGVQRAEFAAADAPVQNGLDLSPRGDKEGLEGGRDRGPPHQGRGRGGDQGRMFVS
jgi:hypothetical protein